MSKKLIIIIIGIVALISVILFVGNRKTSEIAPVKEIPTEVSEKIEGWQTYRSEKFGFEIQYPEGWEFDGARHERPLSFRPSGLDVQYQRRFPKVWSVFVQDSLTNQRIADLLKKDLIEQYVESERRISDESTLFKSHEDRRFIFVDGHKAILIKEAVDEFENWVLVSVYIEKNGKMFILTDVSSAYVNYKAMYGSPLKENFQDFYKSFHFTD